jgi:hypothetical protein
VADLWQEKMESDCYWMGTDGNKFKNLDFARGCNSIQNQ